MNSTEKCLFCHEDAVYFSNSATLANYKVVCPVCSTYYISDCMKDCDLDTIKKYSPYKHLISGLLHEKNELGLQVGTIKTDNVMNLINDSLIPQSIIQKLNKILLYFVKISGNYGEELTFSKEIPYSIGYAKNWNELNSMFSALIELGYFESTANFIHGTQAFKISLDGLVKAEELLNTNTLSKQVFVAMGFKTDLLDALEQAIKPATLECGFKAATVAEKEHNGDITDRIISEIKTSKFVIADFTYNNYGAYFEAGFAQGKGLEVIRTCKKSWFDEVDESGNKKNYLHFDINHYNFILWESFEDLKDKLINRIKATIL